MSGKGVCEKRMIMDDRNKEEMEFDNRAIKLFAVDCKLVGISRENEADAAKQVS